MAPIGYEIGCLLTGGFACVRHTPDYVCERQGCRCRFLVVLPPAGRGVMKHLCFENALGLQRGLIVFRLPHWGHKVGQVGFEAI